MMDYLPREGQHLPRSSDLREAIGLYARRVWPSSTSSHMARCWKISKDQAKNLLKGHASDKTITHIMRAGGWYLCIDVIGSTLGESLDYHLVRERENRDREHRIATARETLAQNRARRSDIGHSLIDRLAG